MLNTDHDDKAEALSRRDLFGMILLALVAAAIIAVALTVGGGPSD